MTSPRTQSHRVSIVESLESRQFLCATVATADTANLAAAHNNTAPIVAKAATAASAGKVIWGVDNSGAQLKFKKTKALPGNGLFGMINESGTFTDEKGNTGTYQLFIPSKLPTQPVQTLNLTWKTKVKFARALSIQFTPYAKRLNAGLNGKTVTFVKGPAGTSAKAVVIVNVGLNLVYMKF